MKIPSYLIVFASLVWGFQVELPWAGIFAGVVLGAAGLVTSKFEFRASDFNRFVDISIVLLAGTVVAALTIEAQNAIWILLKWMPLIVLPIAAAQAYSTKGGIEAASFFLTARRKKQKRSFFSAKPSNSIDVSLIYAFICMISAGTLKTPGLYYFILSIVFFAFVLLHTGSKNFAGTVWIICFAAAVVLGFAGQKSIYSARVKLGELLMRYYQGYYFNDPFRSYTAIGRITRLKLSNTIVSRVSFEKKIPGRIYLLHDSTYNTYADTTWFSRSSFDEIKPEKDNTTWQINPSAADTEKMTLYLRLFKKRAVLSLPPGAAAIEQMRAGYCEKNEMQSVRIEEGPPLIKAVVFYTGEYLFDKRPDKRDLIVPEKERPVVRKLAENLKLGSMTENEIPAALKKHFAAEYTYSLDLAGKGKADTALTNFLLYTKAGHCEYFATAAVFILRQAGIPARYAAGYLVHEYSNLEKRYIVRQKDAHAWVKAFVNGRWQDCDVTPPSFMSLDNENLEPFFMKDFLSFLVFRMSRLRHETGEALFKKYGLWLIMPLLIILFIRLKGTGGVKRVKKETAGRKGKNILPDPFSLEVIDRFIAEKGFLREKYETYPAWFTRIKAFFDEIFTPDELNLFLRVYNEHRFGRLDIAENEKQYLTACIKRILESGSAAAGDQGYRQ